MTNKIIYFDNECQLCDFVIRSVIFFDKKKLFSFSSLRSNYAINKLPIEFTMDLNTYIIEINGVLFTRGSALRIMLKELDFKILFILFNMIPIKFLDFIYDLFGKWRFKIFGRNNNSVCDILDEEIRRRFLF
jgi:predicted DCC family thiol-disulfide oxidoreductase YuxK